MRILKDMVLVKITSDNSNPLVNGFDHIRFGTVFLSGSEEVVSGEEVLFGDEFEAIDISAPKGERYYLMHVANLKIIYAPNDKSSKSNVLSFMNNNKA